MVLAIGLFGLEARRICIDALGGDNVKRRSGDRIFLAIELVREAVIYGGAVRQLPSPRQLRSAVRVGLANIGLALGWICAAGLRLGGIVLPSPVRTVSRKHSDS